MFRHKIKMLFTTSIVVRVVILFNTSNRLFPSSDISQRGFSASSATYSSLIRNCNPRRGRGGHLPPPIGSSNRTALVDTRDSVEPEPRRDQHQRVRRAHQHAIPASSRDTHVFIMLRNMLRRIGNFSRRRRFRFELDFERSSTYGTMDMFKIMVSLYSNLDYRPLCVGGWRVGAGFNVQRTGQPGAPPSA